MSTQSQGGILPPKSDPTSPAPPVQNQPPNPQPNSNMPYAGRAPQPNPQAQPQSSQMPYAGRAPVQSPTPVRQPIAPPDRVAPAPIDRYPPQVAQAIPPNAENVQVKRTTTYTEVPVRGKPTGELEQSGYTLTYDLPKVPKNAEASTLMMGLSTAIYNPKTGKYYVQQGTDTSAAMKDVLANNVSRSKYFADVKPTSVLDIAQGNPNSRLPPDYFEQDLAAGSLNFMVLAAPFTSGPHANLIRGGAIIGAGAGVGVTEIVTQGKATPTELIQGGLAGAGAGEIAGVLAGQSGLAENIAKRGQVAFAKSSMAQDIYERTYPSIDNEQGPIRTQPTLTERVAMKVTGMRPVKPPPTRFDLPTVETLPRGSLETSTITLLEAKGSLETDFFPQEFQMERDPFRVGSPTGSEKGLPKIVGESVDAKPFDALTPEKMTQALGEKGMQSTANTGKRLLETQRTGEVVQQQHEMSIELGSELGKPGTFLMGRSGEVSKTPLDVAPKPVAQKDLAFALGNPDIEATNPLFGKIEDIPQSGQFPRAKTPAEPLASKPFDINNQELYFNKDPYSLGKDLPLSFRKANYPPTGKVAPPEVSNVKPINDWKANNPFREPPSGTVVTGTGDVVHVEIAGASGKSVVMAKPVTSTINEVNPRAVGLDLGVYQAQQPTRTMVGNPTTGSENPPSVFSRVSPFPGTRARIREDQEYVYLSTPKNSPLPQPKAVTNMVSIQNQNRGENITPQSWTPLQQKNTQLPDTLQPLGENLASTFKFDVTQQPIQETLSIPQQIQTPIQNQIYIPKQEPSNPFIPYIPETPSSAFPPYNFPGFKFEGGGRDPFSFPSRSGLNSRRKIWPILSSEEVLRI